MEIHYTSQIGSEYRAELESLLFFNAGQSRMREAILAAVAAHGLPSILDRSGRLEVYLQSGPMIQTLYAFAKTGSRRPLVGLMMYSRLDSETLLAVHLAVADEFSSTGRQAEQLIVLRLVAKLREIAAQIKGVQTLKLLYGHEEIRPFAVKRREQVHDRFLT